MTSEIVVICSDEKRIRVDLNLFPSMMLRALARSEFKDCAETRIIYDSEQFLQEYRKYLPAFDEFFQIEKPLSQASPIFALTLIWEKKESHDHWYSFDYEYEDKRIKIYSYVGVWTKTYNNVSGETDMIKLNILNRADLKNFRVVITTERIIDRNFGLTRCNNGNGAINIKDCQNAISFDDERPNIEFHMEMIKYALQQPSMQAFIAENIERIERAT